MCLYGLIDLCAMSKNGFDLVTSAQLFSPNGKLYRRQVAHRSKKQDHFFLVKSLNQVLQCFANSCN